MNILISALGIKKAGGSTTHLRNFLSTIKRVDKENVYIVCLNKDFILRVEGENIKLLSFDIKSNLHRFYWDQFKIRGVIKKYNIDVLVSLLNFGCINPPVKQINFQRGPTYFCEYYLSTLPFRKKIITVLRRKLLYLTMKSSEILVTPTKTMKNIIRKFYPHIPEKKFRIIPHGFDKDRFLASNNELPLEVKEALEKIPSDITKILYVSHLMPYKGYDILIKAAQKLKENRVKFKLIMTMKREDWQEGYDNYLNMINQYDLEDYTAVLTRIPEDAIASLYKYGDIFVFPSLCESFGFPMVEAMSVGLPIIAAGTPVNMEICGKGALYYDPLDSEGAARNIREVIENNEIREKLRQNAVAQIENSHIAWDEYVKRFFQVLNDVMG